jgi:hypothetical protein
MDRPCLRRSSTGWHHHHEANSLNGQVRLDYARSGAVIGGGAAPAAAVIFVGAVADGGAGKPPKNRPYQRTTIKHFDGSDLTDRDAPLHTIRPKDPRALATRIPYALPWGQFSSPRLW